MIDTIDNNYGFKPLSISGLDGDINYSNKKYLISDDSGNKYIYKVYTDSDELALAKEEQSILSKIRGNLEFKIPEAVPGIKGNSFISTPDGEAVLLKYIDGNFIAEIEQTEDILLDFGKCIGKLHLELSRQENLTFKSRKLFWDLQHAHINMEKAEYISDNTLKKHIDYYFDRFYTSVLPEIHKLRSSFIHGDLNDYNVLVNGGRIAGFIDFGDLCFSPLINELAIATTYVMFGKDNPFEAASNLIRGFNSVVPLTYQELLLLPDLITTRLCVSLCNSAEKRHHSQANEYVLVSEKPAIELLRRWKETSHTNICAIFLSACDKKATVPEMGMDEMLSRRNNILSKALSLSYSRPIYMESSLFQYMYDKEGNTYLDAYNNIPQVGHSHPKVARAISEQSYRLNTNTRYIYDSLVKYGEKLLGYFPGKLNRVYFVNSGSAASDLAIRLARNYTNQKQVMVLEHGYHGNTGTGIEISPYKFDGKGGKGVGENITKLPLPNNYLSGLSGKEYAQEAIELTNNLISNGMHPAAFISEPISGCGGQVPLADDYLKTLYPFLNKSGILTISDEVQVGFGRLGEYFWGYELHGVVPDIVILGKPMGNGHPIGAVVTTQEIADSFSTGMEFFSSFGGNPVSCEAAMAVLEIIEDEELQNNAKEVGAYYLQSLNELAKEYSIIGDVRGSGLFIGIEFTHIDGKPATDVANTVKNRLKEEFILTGTDGPYDNVIKSKPPLCFSKQNVDRLTQTMDSILRKL